MPQLAGLSAIAVPAPVPPLFRALAQALVFIPIAAGIATDHNALRRNRVLDFLILISTICYAHLPSPFFDYIWDVCLIETSFVFLLSRVLAGSERWRHWQLWPLRLLLFRMMFSMGVIKYFLGMPEWRDGTALVYFWPNQPMPGYLAWLAAQLPVGAQKILSAIVFVTEIPGPFLVFCGRRARKVYFLLNLGLQAGIFFTGNYGIFNLLTVVLSLSLFEQKQDFATNNAPLPARSNRMTAAVRSASIGVLAGWLVNSAWYQYAVFRTDTAHLPETSWVFLKNREQQQLPAPLLVTLQAYAAGKVANPYALFGHIAKYRMEIEIRGSYDGSEWRKYRFRVKPDEPDRAPIWYAPHHWRLDHQMYYESFRIRSPDLAARYSFFLGNHWLRNLLRSLLANDAQLSSLFRENPFSAAAPRFLQLRYLYYSFTDLRTQRTTGRYWKTEEPHKGQFFEQAITLSNLHRVP